MYQGKYAKYFSTDIKEDTIMPNEIPDPSFGFSARQFPEAKLNFGWNVIYKPYFIDRVAHVHDGDEYLMFLGGQVPHCFDTFDAEIDFCFGKEQELYTITQPTVVHIPKGMLHCPLEFRKINKPLLFVMLLLTPRFGLTDIDGNKVAFNDETPKTIDLSKLPDVKTRKAG